tara:strand:- start:259 stop:2802 length:2544 start_codon:yes stop_codon:yes gene_type:complete
MDLLQSKLTGSEWDTVEKPVSQDEKTILNLILNGFDDQTIRYNNVKTFISYSKIERSDEVDYFIFKTFFNDSIRRAVDKYGQGTSVHSINDLSFMEGKTIRSLRSSDSIRLKNAEKEIETNKNSVFEYILISMFSNVLKYFYKKKDKYIFYLYTLIEIRKTKIENINNIVLKYIDKLISYISQITEIKNIVYKSVDLIENNKYLIKYGDLKLYEHQKKLFSLFKNYKEKDKATPMFVTYTAPTGTGKTLSPIGLAKKYRVIFVCVARHIGLALAKNAISCDKKIAFGFGCSSANDIRLHYYSAVEYTKNYKSGGIFKVDNSVGTNVEIMICDVQSYITCMHYMLAFNNENDIITYWDEPTITLDYENHELHETIHKNWNENKISKMILSCATLPSNEELQPVICDFKMKFEDAEYHHISSYDCKKSIPILDKDGYSVLPHYLFEDFNEMQQVCNFCTNNRTLLRYFDLNEIVNFIKYVEEVLEYDIIEDSFKGISDITMNNLKECYLQTLMSLEEEDYKKAYTYLKQQRINKFENNKLVRSKSLMNEDKPKDTKLKRTVSVFETNKERKNTGGLLATTSDAYTFTDGPTIYLTDDIDKIGNFYIQQTNIENSVFTKLMKKIEKNREILEKIDKIEKKINSSELRDNGDGDAEYSKKSEIGKMSNESSKMQEEVYELKKKLSAVTLDAMYSPNTIPHQHIWAPEGEIVENAFVSDIGEENTKVLMKLNIENIYKVLLLLGIGTFKYHENKEYVEIMKELAEKQKLFMIIASTDYIYGTNYQFCHGFIGKDLLETTQQKLLQALGRIGRNNIQQDYTIRVRDNEIIKKLFTRQTYNLEAINMCKLLNNE